MTSRMMEAVDKKLLWLCGKYLKPEKAFYFLFMSVILKVTIFLLTERNYKWMSVVGTTRGEYIHT